MLNFKPFSANFRNHLTSPGWTTRWTFLALAGLALVGTGLILYLTAIAPWAYSDSTAYLAVARNIAAGQGIVIQDPNGGFSFYTWHPPLFPLLLSLPISLGMQALQAARWLNAILFGLTIFLAGAATFRFTRSFWLACAVAGLVLASYDSLNAYSGVMSEGLFIFWCLLSLLMLARAIQSSHQPTRLLLLAGAAAGLATLTRYTGLALLVAGLLSILLFSQGRMQQRLRKTLSYFLLAGVLTAAWLLPVFFATRSLGSRQVQALADLPEKFRTYSLAFQDVLSGWLPFFYRGNHILSPALKLLIGLLLLAGFIGLTARWLRRHQQPANRDGLLTWLGVLGLFCVAYVALHLGTYLSIAAQPDVNGRLLLPLYVGGVLLAAGMAAFLGRALPKTWAAGLLFVALALFSVWYFRSKVQTYQYEMHHYGQGFTSKLWLGNPIFCEISALDPNLALYSNNPALVLFYTDRFPATLQLDPTGTIYDLQIPSKAGLVLFTNSGLGKIGDEYGNTATAASQSYQLIYENEIGYIFLPR